MYYELVFSGFGGQGILLAGDILAHAAMLEGRHVTWMPSYGVEMRGGAASCTVIISAEKIGSPLADEPHGVISMSKPSLLKFQGKIRKGGLLVVNTDFVDPKMITRSDIKTLCLAASEAAFQAVGEHRMANMVILGAFLASSGIVSLNTVEEAIKQIFTGEKEKFIPPMIKALKWGAELEGRSSNGK